LPVLSRKYLEIFQTVLGKWSQICFDDFSNVERPLSVTSKEDLKNGEKSGLRLWIWDIFPDNNEIVKIEVRSTERSGLRSRKCGQYKRKA